MKFKNNILILASGASDCAAVSEIEKVFKRDYQGFDLIVLDESHFGHFKLAGGGRSVGETLAYKLPAIYERVKGFKAFKSKKKELATSEKQAVSDKLRGTTKRIYNAVIRYCPEVILVTSPDTLHTVIEAKRKTKFRYPVVALLNSFTFDRSFFSFHADGYIAENNDLKNQITSLGFPSDKVYVIGLPITETVPDNSFVIDKKTKLGLNASDTVYLSGKTFDVKKVFDLLLDQGDVINIIVNCGTDGALHTDILKAIDQRGAKNVKVYYQSDAVEENEDTLTAADCVMTTFDTKLVYRAFLLHIPVIVFSPITAEETADFQYLSEKKLAYFAADYNDTIVGMYKILQTNLKNQLVTAAAIRTHENGLGDICKLLASFAKGGNTDV